MRLSPRMHNFIAAAAAAVFLVFLNPLGSRANAAENIQILESNFSSTTVNAGDLIRANIRIKNTGDAVATMGGPLNDSEPLYYEGESFLSKGYGLETGKYRVGIDFPGSHDIAGITYPYRWSLGGVMTPGQEVWLSIAFKPVKPGVKTYSFGIVKEGERWVQDHIFPQTLQVNEIGSLSLPIPYKALEVLYIYVTNKEFFQHDFVRFDFVIKNTGYTALYSQGPFTGFSYYEGESFRRICYSECNISYPAINGNVRVGIDFAGSHDRLGITYPYRWGFQGSLEPGQTTVVSGSIRLDNPQTTTFKFGVVIEGERWLGERENVATVVVKPTPFIQPPISIPVSSPVSIPVSFPISFGLGQINLAEVLEDATSVLSQEEIVLNQDTSGNQNEVEPIDRIVYLQESIQDNQQQSSAENELSSTSESEYFLMSQGTTNSANHEGSYAFDIKDETSDLVFGEAEVRGKNTQPGIFYTILGLVLGKLKEIVHFVYSI